MTKAYSVDWFGSHPDADNDDCWTGEDFDTLDQALASFHSTPGSRYSPTHTIAFIVLNGPNVYQVRANPGFDPKRCAREAFSREWASEHAMQMGMGLGVEAFNDAMGY